jgi:hypothetical protein
MRQQQKVLAQPEVAVTVMQGFRMRLVAESDRLDDVFECESGLGFFNRNTTTSIVFIEIFAFPIRNITPCVAVWFSSKPLKSFSTLMVI